MSNEEAKENKKEDTEKENGEKIEKTEKKENPNNELEECLCKKEEYLDGWKRERAGFLNYKKDEMERIGGLIKYATEEIILKFLPILDNFYIAEKEIKDELKKDNCVKGLLNIKMQIQDLLKGLGVEEIKCLGEKFDPNFMEAIDEIEAKDKESGTVIEEIKKGYTLQGKIIRPSKVKISK